MKGKISLMWRGALALVLVLSLSLVMAVPVAADVSPATVAVDPPLAGEVAEYTIGFDINTSLGVAGTITVVFDSTTPDVPATYAAGDITVQGANVSASGSVKTVTITLANPIAAPGTVTVVFTTDAGIVNPTKGDKTLTVATSAEGQAVISETYAILALPAVTLIEPDEGNVGDTMWVEVTGANFTGDADTNASTTTLDFGGGITVDSTKFISATEIDVEITITAPGAVLVAATTAAGEGTVDYTFTANDADTAQVDVWEAYTPTATTFVTGTLVPRSTTMSYATITLAEAACDNIETVIVHAATYEENVVIDQTITLLSLDGADSTIIDGGTAVLIVSVTVAATIDGFTIQGDATTTNQAGILVNGSTVSGFAIQNNEFVDIANDNLKVWSNAGAIDGGLIDSNTLTGLGSDAQRACILVESTGTNTINDVTISNNIISNFLGVDACEWPGIQVSQNTGAAVTDITITGNTISDGATGIKLCGGITGMTDAIANNTISGMFEAGVSADDIGDAWPTFDLENNIITGNKYGIELGGSTSNHIIKYNDISGNSAYGLLVPTSDAGTVDARYNWWGHISGPSSGSQLTAESWWSEKVSTALGSGDAMSWYVDTWDPWLTRDQATAISDGIAYHGSIYPLEAGWNTLSVPLALDDSADTLNDIVSLGDFFVTSGTGQNYLGGYYYDTVNVLWVPLPGTYEFTPCEAVYVEMAADASFPVLFSGVFGLPSVSLPAGWNLIGSGFGVDKADTGSADNDDYGIAPYASSDSPDSLKGVKTALASLGANASVVISPSLPGQTLAWGTVATDDTTTMIVGEGYWVFMTAPATLAGFEVTPIYWIDL